MMSIARTLSLRADQTQPEPQISSVTLAARKAESRKLLPDLHAELNGYATSNIKIS